MEVFIKFRPLASFLQYVLNIKRIKKSEYSMTKTDSTIQPIKWNQVSRFQIYNWKRESGSSVWVLVRQSFLSQSLVGNHLNRSKFVAYFYHWCVSCIYAHFHFFYDCNILYFFCVVTSDCQIGNKTHLTHWFVYCIYFSQICFLIFLSSSFPTYFHYDTFGIILFPRIRNV